jgi:raffinose/stachyose/melibiose transport system permease protein
MAFLLPALVINVVIILIPALLTIAMAFVEWDGVSIPTFVGLDNFRTIFADPVFFSAVLNNIKWTLIFLTVPIATGLVAGSLLLVVRRGRTFFQIVYFLPVIIATVVIARVWQGMIYNPESGLLGWLKLYGFVLSDPLALPPTALYAVASVDLWHWWGFLAVIFFAALRQVDMAQIDAAMLDGANFLQLMRYVLLPAIRPTITLMMIMTVIWSFLVFDFVYVLTQGGPAYSSEVLSTLSALPPPSRWSSASSASSRRFSTCGYSRERASDESDCWKRHDRPLIPRAGDRSDHRDVPISVDGHQCFEDQRRDRCQSARFAERSTMG